MIDRKKRPPGRREVDYLEASVILNDFVDHDMPELSGAEAKLALVILRKTIGWGKRSEKIGRKELVRRTRLNPDTVKQSIRPACQKVGITIEQQRDGGTLPRRLFTWPINSRVAATLEKARRQRVGGKIPPRQQGKNTSHTGGQNPATQCNPFVQVVGDAGVRRWVGSDGCVRFLDLSIYGGAEGD